MSDSIKKLAYSEKELLDLVPLSSRTLYNLRRDNKIPFTKMGDRVLYPAEQIHRWIDGRPWESN
jgi:excisionase family DNA binding protein